MTVQAGEADPALNMHMTVADMFNLMTRHATYLRAIAYDIPAAMQQVNSTYLNDIYPYNPDPLLTRLLTTPIDSEEKKAQLEELLHCSDDALLVLRDIIGYQLTTANPTVRAWSRAFEQHITAYPLGKAALYHEGFAIAADIAAAAQFLHLINPDLREQQRATNLSDPQHMKPDEWIWLGGRRLNKALRAYLVFVGEDVAKFEASLVDRPKLISWRARLRLRIKEHLKKNF